ncbi:MAG: hypothetical protein ACLU8F_06515 [Clostridia bacterium]
MINGSAVFTYLGKKSGVTKDGEQYLALNVLTKDTKQKFSFVIKDSSIIDKVSSRKFIDFQDIKLFFNIDRVFNNETRYSHWEIQLVGVGE